MKKTLIFFGIISLIGLIILFSKEIKTLIFAQDEPSMSFSNELETDGCLGLNYHRVLKDNVLTQSTRWFLNSDELVKYSVLTTELQHQLNALTDAGAVFLSEDELLQAKNSGDFPDKCVWISFDDIDYSVYEHAFPILKEAGVPFTLFLIAGHVGDKDFNNLKMTTWDELREMQKSGLASFGSHTYDMHRFEDETPVFLLAENRETFKHDLQKSIQTIEQELGVTVRSFAYPYGNTDDSTSEVIREQGLEAGYILAPQTIRPTDDNFHLNRVLLNDTTFNEVVLPFIESQ